MNKVKLKTLAMLLFFVSIVLVSYNNVYASDASNTLNDSSTTTQIVLQAGKSYEFDNSGDSEITISNNSDWNTIKYDYERTDGQGNKEWDRNVYGDIRIEAKGKTVVTVRDKDITCSIPKDTYSSMTYKESSVKALTEFTLQAGKSYEFNNPGDSSIQIDNNSNSDWQATRYDYVRADAEGSKEWDRNVYGDIKVEGKGKTIVTVRDKDITCWMPSDIYSTMTYKESSEKALAEFTLQAGKSYEFNNPGDSSIRIDNNSNSDWQTTRYDYVTTDEQGSKEWDRNVYGYIKVEGKGKTLVTVRDKDMTCWMPSDIYSTMTYKESSEKALAEFTLQAGKSYEFNNPGDSSIRIDNNSNSDWQTTRYDYVTTDEQGSKEWDRNVYGYIKVEGKGKTLVTVRDKDITCWMPSDIYSTMTYKESSQKALTEFTLKAGKGYEITNTGDSDIQINNNSDWDKIKYDYISINEDGQVNSESNTYGTLRIGNKDKFTLLVKNSDIICWCPEDIFSNIQYKEVDMPQPEQGKVSVLKNEIIKKADGKILVVSYIGNGTSNNEQIDAVAKMKDASNKVLEVKGSSVSINSQSVVVAVFAFDSKYPTNNIEVCIPEKSDKAGVDSYGTRQEDGQVITTGVVINNTDKQKDLGISSISYDENGKIIAGSGNHKTVQPNSMENLNVVVDTDNKTVGKTDIYSNNNIVDDSDSSADDSKCEYADQLLGSYYSGANPDFSGLYGSYDASDDWSSVVEIDPQKVLSDKTHNSCITLPTGSYVTVGFKNPITGTIYIKEQSPAGDYALVLVSSDDKNYTKLGIAITGIVTGFDLKEYGFNEPVSSVTVIGLDNNGAWPGFDLVYIKGDGVVDKILTHSISGLGAADSIRTQYKKEIDSQSKAEDPVDMSTGAHTLDRTLLKENAPQPFEFNISYNSLLLNEGVMGKGWENNYDTKLEFLDNGNITVHWASNHANIFVLDHDNIYQSHDLSMQFYSLIKNEDGSYTLTDKDSNVYTFNKQGQVISKKNKFDQGINYVYDNSGKLSKVVESISGEYFAFYYNEYGLLEKVTDGLNREVAFKYDGTHNLITIIDADGNVINYTYNDEGQVLSGAYGNGVQIFKDVYDDKGRVISQDDSLNSNKLTTFTYDETSEPGNIITTVTDRNGNKRTVTHDKNHNLIKVQDELGNVKTYTYDSVGNRLTETDENGHTTKYTYDVNNNVTSITDALGNVTKMTYDSKNNLLSMENSNGKKILYTYDPNNNLLTTTDVMGNVSKNAYDSNGLLISSTDKNGAVTNYAYKNGLLAEETDSLGNKVAYEYDAAGRKIKSVDALGKVTSFEYDNNDNVLSVTDPLNDKVSSTYDAAGNKLTSTDAKKNTTKYIYDTNENLISVVDILGNKTTYEYDGEGRVIKITDSKGNVTTYTYDAAGRKIASTDSLGNTIKMNYDAAGNLTSSIDALGNTVLTKSYDELNRVVTTTDAGNNKTTNKYDSLGRVTSVMDAMGNSSKFNYDDLNRLISSIDSLNNISSQTYDAVGNKTSTTDANGNKATYTYDSEGKLISETSGAGKTIKYEYNANGLLAKQTNARGQVTVYSYDDAGKLVGFTDGLGSVQYTYDANGNVTAVKDSSGTIVKEYDPLNRVIKYTDASGNSISYEYDSTGNMIAITYPDNKKVKYTYDAANKLKTVTDWNGNVTAYEYDADGRLVKETKPDGSICTYTYNKLSQIVELKDLDKNGKIINKYSYTYDANGNIKSEKSYIKDAAPVESNTNMAYGQDNRITAYNGENITFDADGNMTSGPLNGSTAAYKYDCRNRLISVGNTQYVYDALNNRIAVIENGNKISYVINPNASLSQVLIKKDAAGSEIFYVYGLGLISEEDLNGIYRIYHFDSRGNTVALTDKEGNITDRFQYDIYGKLVSHAGTSKTPFLYVGKDGVMTDSNGLYYMRARYYNTDMNRFVNQDVVVGNIQDSQSLNQFAYTKGNPINMKDPNGKTPWAIASGIAGVVFNVGGQVVTDCLTGQRSDWETYVGDATGGFAGGFVLASTGNVALSSAASAAATNVTKQGLYYAFDRQHFDFETGCIETGLDFGLGYGIGKLGDAATDGLFSENELHNNNWANKTIKRLSTALRGKYAQVELWEKGFVGADVNILGMLPRALNEDSIVNGIKRYARSLLK